MKPALSIVIPALDEAPALARRLHALQALRRRGAREAVARGEADVALLAPRGRASQMNAGAAACPADLLLFPHADTALPEGADAPVRRATAGSLAWGRFDVRIDSPRRTLRSVAALFRDMAWSTASVMRDTRARAAAPGGSA